MLNSKQRNNPSDQFAKQDIKSKDNYLRGHEKDNISEILKDEINQLKNLTKEANKLIVEKTNPSDKFENGTAVHPDIKANDSKTQTNLLKEPKFLQIEAHKENAQNVESNNIFYLASKLSHKQNLETEEEIKEEFEDRFTYLLNKLDVVYQINDKDN